MVYGIDLGKKIILLEKNPYKIGCFTCKKRWIDEKEMLQGVVSCRKDSKLILSIFENVGRKIILLLIYLTFSTYSSFKASKYLF
jgi:hypothetical protein